MNNSHYFENEEKTINLTKIWHIFIYRKQVIFLCFTLILSICAVFTIVCPKIYSSEAKILISKNNSTYLSDINPFALSDKETNGLMKFGSQNNLSNEIEIIKSPLVLDSVIKENGLKYEKGVNAGEYLKIKDFLKRNFSIENPKDTNILKISYKSKDPATAYQVIRSILTNYRTIYENINLLKASNDKNFLMKSYSNAKDAVENKITKLKQFKSHSITASDTALNNMNILLSLQDKRINKNASSISQVSVESKKLESELDQELENLKYLKSRYEWSKQIESMSKSTTNLIVLEEPAITTQYSEPKPLFNIFLAIIFSTILSYFVVLYKEKNDKKLSYSDLSENFKLINTKTDLNSIKTKIILGNTEDLGIISLGNKEFTDYFNDLIKQDSGYDIKVRITSADSKLNEFLSVMNSSDNLVFIGHIGISDRELYNSLTLSAKELNKKIIGELVCEDKL